MYRITAILLFITTICTGQVELSDRAEISVLTCGPWQGQLYTAFGHSAFRVHDPVNRIDAVYNYGVFDFDKPNFYLNFARGHNVYQLGVSDFDSFSYSYIYYNRYIHEQVLNLSPEEKQKLFDFLQWNALPENQEYLYDYFYDNCATKIPEVVLQVFGDAVTFNDDHITTRYSFRELTDLYLKQQPWGDLGIDIGLGLPTDKTATPYEYMFLPDFVEAGFANASITRNGETFPLVRRTNIIYESVPDSDPPSLLNPLLVFFGFLLLTLFLSYRDVKRGLPTRGFDAALFGATGFLGVCLFLLWVATDHHASAKNMNLLWAWPTHIVAAFAAARPRPWLAKYFLAVAVLTLGLLVVWPFLPQKLHYSLIPFLAAIAIRAFTRYRLYKRVK